MTNDEELTPYMRERAEQIAASLAREEEQFRRLAANPLVNVIGVVEPGSVFGSQTPGGPRTVYFDFSAWRIDEGPLHDSPLRLLYKPISQDGKWSFDGITPYAVQKVCAHVDVAGFAERSEALVVEFVGLVTDDSELNRHAEELRKPVTFAVEGIGQFQLNRDLGWIQMETDRCGETIRLNLATNGIAVAQELAKTAGILFHDTEVWNKRMKEQAVIDLMQLKHENWADDDGSRYTPERFTAKMALFAMTVREDHSFVFSYRDGRLFFGHHIEVEGSIQGGPRYAAFHG